MQNNVGNYRIELKDNQAGEPGTKNGYGKPLGIISEQSKIILGHFAGRRLVDLEKLGVTVFSNQLLSTAQNDDHSKVDLEVFSLGCNEILKSRWINTGNCMGVIRLRVSEQLTVQIEIGSRFDKDHEKPYFLTYLLSKVFGGSVIDKVDAGIDDMWDMLLAFVFRRRLLEAGAVGLFRQYRTFHHNDARIRGRIDVDRHLRQNVPFLGNVAYSTHEITFDNPTNHLIRHAWTKVNQKWPNLMTGDSGLTDLRHQLKQSTPSWHPGRILDCVRRKENRRPIKHPYFQSIYEPLRQLSLSILRDEGASLYQQQQEVEGVLFDGSWLWEEYLWTLLKRVGFEHSENKNQRGAWNPISGVHFYPDFFHVDGRIVLDAKYKGENSRDLQSDARQVFGYMFLLGARHGGLIKPQGAVNSRVEIKLVSPLENTPLPVWHIFSLPPPTASTAEEFKLAMKKAEDEFSSQISKELNISETCVFS